MQSKSPRSAIAVGLAAIALGAGASAQSLLATQGEVLAASGNPVPGIPHALYPSGTTSWMNPVIDESGNVLFGCSTMVDDGSGLSGLVLANNRAYFRGTSAGTTSLFLRSDDPAPLLPGLRLVNQTGTAPGPGTAFRLNKSGEVMFGSWLGTATTGVDDTILYASNGGAWQIVAREGDAAPGAPGVAGCTYGGSTNVLNSLSASASGFNAAGRVMFKPKLTGGDVSGASNDDIWYAGLPGSLEVVIREGDSIGAQVVTSLGFSLSQLNAAGQMLHDQSLSTSVGTPPATTADNQTVLLFTPGVGNTIYLREGDPAPGTVGATFNNSANSWGVSNSNQTSGNNFNDAAQYLISLQLLNGDVVAGVNDMALYLCSPSGHTMVLRRGDAAPGLPGLTMDTVHTTGTPVSMAASPGLSDTGVICFRGRVAGGSVTANDDTGVWAGAPGALQLVYREGDVAPGSGGLLFGDAAATVGPFMNAAGIVLFQNRLGGTTDALYMYDANAGGPLVLVAIAGDALEVAPSVFKNVSGFGNVSNGDSDGSPMMFSANKNIALRVTFTDNTNAVVKIDGIPQPTAYCTAGTSTNGCVPSIGATGTPSVAATSGFTLDVTASEGNRQGILYYGISGPTAAVWASGSTSFQCVKAPTQRMGVQNSGGTDGACDGAYSRDWLAYLAANPAALGQPFSAGAVVNAQCWYRDPPAPKTTNLSNALQFVTVP